LANVDPNATCTQSCSQRIDNMLCARTSLRIGG
jgi:hypothetical protein